MVGERVFACVRGLAEDGEMFDRSKAQRSEP